MHDFSIQSDEFRAGLTFDPVCGAVLKEEDTNQFFDGERIHYFCCAMCRRIFIDEWRATKTAKLSPEHYACDGWNMFDNTALEKI